MKIAYLILAHNNPAHLDKLINSLNSDFCDFYIHFDKKSKTLFNLLNYKNVYYLNNRISIFWGGFSIVQATINLLIESSKEHKYDYYILLSGVDYPIRSNRYIKNFFIKNSGKEFIDLYKMPLYDKSFNRIDKYFFEGNTNRYLYFFQMHLNKTLKSIPYNRRLPSRFDKFVKYAGANWWALSDSCINYIIKFLLDNPSYASFYKHTHIPDEMFFQTIVGNSPFINNLMTSLTYTDWSKNVKPAIIGLEHLKDLSKEYIPVKFGNGKKYTLFARKFTDESDEIINKINIKLRK